MATTTSNVIGNFSMTEPSTTHKSTDTEESITLSPFAVGLMLEGGILALVFGNLLVLLSLRFQKHWVVTDVFLLSLSTADFLGGSFPLQIVIFMNYFLRKEWTAFLCGLYIIVVNSLRLASASTVTLIAIERAFMILSPFKYHTTITLSRIKKAVVFTWFIGVLFASLPFTGVGKSGYEEGKCFYHFTDTGRTYAILMLITSFVLLTIVLTCCIAIRCSSTKFIRRQTQMDTKNKRAGNEASRGSVPPQGVREIRRLSHMMALVVFLYYISWLPILISNIITMATDRKSSKLVVLLTGMVSLIYAVANPIIYGAMSMRYRWAYKRVFGAACGVCSNKERSQSISFSSGSTIRSRTQTNRQMSNDQSSKSEVPENQKTEHAQVQNTAPNSAELCHDYFSVDVTDVAVTEAPVEETWEPKQKD